MQPAIKNRLEVLELKKQYEALLQRDVLDAETRRGLSLIARDPEGRALVARLYTRMNELLQQP
jgi:hypothetical protein